MHKTIFIVFPSFHPFFHCFTLASLGNFHLSPTCIFISIWLCHPVFVLLPKSQMQAIKYWINNNNSNNNNRMLNERKTTISNRIKVLQNVQFTLEWNYVRMVCKPANTEYMKHINTRFNAITKRWWNKIAHKLFLWLCITQGNGATDKITEFKSNK